MDIVSPGRMPPGVMNQLRVQPRRWLHRFPAMTAKTQIYKREIQPPPGLNLWGDSLPRAQVPAETKSMASGHTIMLYAAHCNPIKQKPPATRRVIQRT